MNRRSFMRLISSAFVVDDGQKKKKKNLLTGSRGIFRKFYPKLFAPLFTCYFYLLTSYCWFNRYISSSALELLID